jgi:hypothetical protein
LLFPIRPINLKGYNTCKISRQGVLNINYPHIIDQNEFSIAAFILEKCKEVSSIFEINEDFQGGVFSD